MTSCKLLLLFRTPIAVNVSRLDLRIGKIVGVKYHPNADTLYIEQSEHHIKHAYVRIYVPTSDVTCSQGGGGVGQGFTCVYVKCVIWRTVPTK